jgi:hypothetical protein
VTGQQLEVVAREHSVDVVEIVDGIAEVGEGARDIPAAIGATVERHLAQRNLFGEAERLAARSLPGGRGSRR